jgi:4-hydroxy-2-oxoheptanedioate aldolase
MKRGILFSMVFAALCSMTGSSTRAEPTPLYNTAKQKLLSGKPIVGGTIYTSDPNIYCAMAEAGFDFLWIEMQHSPLTFSEVATMIKACKGAPAIPFIRVPDATEGDIQKATDVGALGIIVPMVESVSEAEAAVQYAKYPPAGRRSQGSGQYGELWGGDYRKTANENIMVVAMIESPNAAAIADKIAAVPGSTWSSPRAETSKLHWIRDGRSASRRCSGDHTTRSPAGKEAQRPLHLVDRKGFTFFQAAGEAALIKAGAKAMFENAKRLYEY